MCGQPFVNENCSPVSRYLLLRTVPTHQTGSESSEGFIWPTPGVTLLAVPSPAPTAN